MRDSEGIETDGIYDHDTTLRDFLEAVGAGFRNEFEIWYIRSDRYHAPYQNWSDRIRVEYNEEFTAEQTSEDRHNLTMLFSWPMKDNTDLYFLVNDYEVDGDEVCAAFFKIVYRF